LKARSRASQTSSGMLTPSPVMVRTSFKHLYSSRAGTKHLVMHTAWHFMNELCVGRVPADVVLGFLRQRTEGGPPARTGTGVPHAFVHLYLRLSDVRIIAAR